MTVSKGLDPDQDRHSVRPDLGPNRLQKLSADDVQLQLARNELQRDNTWIFFLFAGSSLLLEPLHQQPWKIPYVAWSFGTKTEIVL